MKTTTLRSGKIVSLPDKISELVVDQGVEMNDELVDELHDYLLAHQAETTGLLVNKKHDYAYAFSTQNKICDLAHIRAVAFVCYRDVSRIITELIAKLPREHPWNFRIFNNYDDGLAWLIAETGDD